MIKILNKDDPTVRGQIERCRYKTSKASINGNKRNFKKWFRSNKKWNKRHGSLWDKTHKELIFPSRGMTRW